MNYSSDTIVIVAIMTWIRRSGKEKSEETEMGEIDHPSADLVIP